MNNIKSKIKTILGKKWAFPALYIIVAVIILGVMLMYQDPNDYTIGTDELGLQEVDSNNSYSEEYLGQKFGQLNEFDSVPAANRVEVMKWPIEDPNEVYISMRFFDVNSSEDEMKSAIISFQNELWPHNGIDISSNNEELDVIATLSGEIIRADKDPILGYTVELQHQEGLITKYSSLDELKVSKGDKVKQGDILGLAGRNIFEKDYGVHLHYEVVKDGIPYNPELFFTKNVNEILDYIVEANGIESTEQETNE